MYGYQDNYFVYSCNIYWWIWLSLAFSLLPNHKLESWLWWLLWRLRSLITWILCMICHMTIMVTGWQHVPVIKQWRYVDLDMIWSPFANSFQICLCRLKLVLLCARFGVRILKETGSMRVAGKWVQCINLLLMLHICVSITKIKVANCIRAPAND